MQLPFALINYFQNINWNLTIRKYPSPMQCCCHTLKYIIVLVKLEKEYFVSLITFPQMFLFIRFSEILYFPTEWQRQETHHKLFCPTLPCPILLTSVILALFCGCFPFCNLPVFYAYRTPQTMQKQEKSLFMVRILILNHRLGSPQFLNQKKIFVWRTFIFWGFEQENTLNCCQFLNRRETRKQ